MKIELSTTLLDYDDIGTGVVTVDGIPQIETYSYNGMMSSSSLVENLFYHLHSVKIIPQHLRPRESVNQYNQRCGTRIVLTLRYF